MSLTQQRLIRWYRKHQRDLPWRHTTDPYAIWVSEIMLQQTTVQTVLAYYVRFLTQFPTVSDLAVADEEAVLRAWEGLGYYRRARSLHQGAKVINSRGGRFPQSLAEWQELPGIGRYTAGAIFSFSTNQPAPIVEANTQRLHARLLGLCSEITKATTQKQLWQHAEEWVHDFKSPREINYALMELGNQICKPTLPLCDVCPLSGECLAYQQKTQHEIPKLAEKKQLTAVVEWCVALEHEGKYLIRKRATGERWAGMWDFLREVEPVTQAGKFSGLARPHTKPKLVAPTSFPLLPCSVEELSALEHNLLERYKLPLKFERIICVMTHHVTQYKITLVCLIAKLIKLSPMKAEKLYQYLLEQQMNWVSQAELASYPLSVSARALANLLKT